MKPPLHFRLIGLAVYSTISIAAFTFKMVWWQMRSPPPFGAFPIGPAIILIVLALFASYGTWTQRPWGYLLAALVTGRENWVEVTDYSAQPSRYYDLFDTLLAGIPVLIGMVSAIALLIGHYSKRGEVRISQSDPAQ